MSTAQIGRHAAVEVTPPRVILLARHHVADEYHVVVRDLPATAVTDETTAALANGWTDVIVAEEVLS